MSWGVAVAVYSTADAECAHVKAADHAICIGPPPPASNTVQTNAGGAQNQPPAYTLIRLRAENSSFARIP